MNKAGKSPVGRRRPNRLPVALVLYEFAAPVTSVTHTNTNILDGWDVSFFAGVNASSSAVPTPALLPLFLIGLPGITRWKPTRKSLTTWTAPILGVAVDRW